MGINLVKRKNASELVLTVMIWGILGLLGTRLYLEIMGYPQIGKGQWHITHAFIGGMIMTLGMMADLIFYGGKAKKIAAGIFGVGLGMFIDEIGKYLSRDNNYFFQPAIILMYIFFIILFLIYKYLERRETGRDVIEKETQWGWEKEMWNRIRKVAYQKVFRRKLVIYSLLAVAAWQVVAGIGDAIYLWGTFKNDKDINIFTLKSLTDLMVALMFGIGIYMVSRKKQKKGLNFFRYGLLVNIFLSSVFKFYFEQFSGVIGVGFSVAIYYGLDRMRKELI